MKYKEILRNVAIRGLEMHLKHLKVKSVNFFECNDL